MSLEDAKFKNHIQGIIYNKDALNLLKVNYIEQIKENKDTINLLKDKIFNIHNKEEYSTNDIVSIKFMNENIETLEFKNNQYTTFINYINHYLSEIEGPSNYLYLVIAFTLLFIFMLIIFLEYFTRYN